MPKEKQKRLPEHVSNRVPPHSQEAESAVLGSILLDPKAFRKCRKDGLLPTAFYTPSNKIVYEAICEAEQAKQQPDVLIVTDRLKNAGKLNIIGGTQYLTRLIDSTPTAAHIEHYLRIVQGMSKRREVIELCRTAEDEAYTSEENEEELLSRIKFSFHALGYTKKAVESVLEVTRKMADKFNKARDSGVVGLRSRWRDYHQSMLGYQEGKVTVVAARPAQGKTTYALNEILHKALLRIPCLILSIEMSMEDLVGRLISDLMGLDLKKFKLGQATYEERQAFMRGGEIIDRLPIYFEHGNFTVEQIAALIREYREEHGVQLVAIDYIQVVAPTVGAKFANRNTELTHVSQNIMHVTGETMVHTLLLSQLSRYEVSGKYKVKEPELHHLRDCGAIEQDAEVVVFIYQDPEEDRVCFDNAPTKFKLGKIRGAPPDWIDMVFEKSNVRFTGMDGFDLKHLVGNKFSDRPDVRTESATEQEVPF